MRNRFTVIKSEQGRAYIVVDSLTGRTVLDTENPKTAERKAKELNAFEAL